MMRAFVILKKNLGIISVLGLALLFLFYSVINIIKSAFDEFYNRFTRAYICYFINIC
jgi:hypothetical protein